MLTVKKNVTLTGTSTVDSTVVERYTASIDSENPSNMTLNSTVINKSLYKENRTDCRTDRADFEDQAYTLQEEMEAALESE